MKKFGIFFLVTGLIIAGCVTTKKKGDVSKFKKGYNSLTEHYNYWFNANEMLRLTEDKMLSTYVDNYNQLLPLYPEITAESAPYKKDFETVEKKAAMGIGLHTVGNWTDDCYLLMGESQYYKRDFETAENTFRYIQEELNPKKGAKTTLKKTKGKKTSASKAKENKKKADAKKKAAAKKKADKKKSSKKKKSSSKKKGSSKSDPKDKKAPVDPKVTDKPAEKAPEADPDESRLEVSGKNPYSEGRRTSAWPEAMIWFGRTLIEREKYEEAEFLFRELQEDIWFPKSLRDDLAKAEAHLWIKQKKYEKASVSLDQAIKYADNKKERARMAFIQAQLFEKAGNTEKAYAALGTVLGSKPNFALAFNARLHQILDGWYAGTIKSSEANRSLEKLLKDSRNREYQDQIYYTLGEIALEEKQKNEAIGYYKKSLTVSAAQSPQRAETFLKLADLYYETESFVLAKAYYDSTITVLSAKDERYQRASLYAKNLTEIARLITTINDNDSIVRVYNMSEAERADLAKKIKKQREDDAAKQAVAEQAKNVAAQNAGKASVPIANAGAKASTFYFYSEAAVKKGKKDFSRVWGDRKLDDNWRRSQRLSSGGSGDEAVAQVDSASTKKNVEADVADIFKDIPRNESEMAVIHLATYEAMYKLGTLYRDRLENNRKCSVTLEEMQTRYPTTDRYEKETWYYCYLAFTDLSNTPRAKHYLDLLVDKYPNSAYTRALTDPNFLNAGKEKEKELNSFYEQTYQVFQKGDYKVAFDRCEEAPKKFGSTNPIMAKFALLSALCTGNLQGNEAYCKALNDVIGRFPESAESTRAKEIARLLSCKGFETNDPKKQEIDDAFVTEDDKLHYFLVVLGGAEIKLEAIKNAISDYNRENHRNDQLRLSNIYLGASQEQPIIVLRKFDNKEKGLKYLEEVKNKKDFLGETSKLSYNKEFFIITQENYRRVLKNKTLDGYREFFKVNYLKE